MAARLPGYELVDPFGGLADLQGPGAADARQPGGVLRRRPAAHPARGPVRGPAGPDPAPGAAGRDDASWPPRLSIVSAERISAELTKLICRRCPAARPRGIRLLVDTGVADEVLPEIPALRLETDEHFRHKDVYQHSLTVLDQAIALEDRTTCDQDLVLRLAALLHDIGKPKTRSRLPGNRVAFHHHEVVGAKMARKRLTALRFPNDVVDDVSRLVELHLRFHGYGERRVDRLSRPPVRHRRGPAAGPAARPDQGRLHDPQPGQGPAAGPRLRRPGGADHRAGRAGGAGRHPPRPQRRRDHGDPDIKPGPLVGKAYRFLLELRLEHGPLGHDRAVQELLRWAEGEGLAGPARPRGRQPSDG